MRVRIRPPPSRLPLPGPLSPPGPSAPSACRGSGGEGPRGKEEGTVKAGRPPPPPSAARSGSATSLAPTPLPEPRPRPRGDSRVASKRRHSGLRQREPQQDPAGPDRRRSAVWDYQENKTKNNVEKAKALSVLSVSCLLSLCICALTKSRFSSVRCPRSSAAEKSHQVGGGLVHRATLLRILERFVFSDLFLGLPNHLCGSFGD